MCSPRGRGCPAADARESLRFFCSLLRSGDRLRIWGWGPGGVAWDIFGWRRTSGTALVVSTWEPSEENAHSRLQPRSFLQVLLSQDCTDTCQASCLLLGVFLSFFSLAAIPGLQMLQGALKSKSFYFSVCVCVNSAAYPKAGLRQSVALHVRVSDINMKPFG